MDSGPIEIESTSQEQVLVTYSDVADPTGDTPEFVVTLIGASDPSGTWQAGAWHGTYQAKTSRVYALSPLVGVGAVLDVESGSDYRLWMRVGTVVKPCPRPLRIR